MWHPARIVKVRPSRRHKRHCVILKLEVLSGDYKGLLATDIMEPQSVFHQCHTKALWDALGGTSPKEGDVLDIRVEGDKNDFSVQHKGYRRARSSVG